MILFVGDRKGLDLLSSDLVQSSINVIDDCTDIDDIVSKTRSDKRYTIAVFDINYFENCTDDKLLQAFYLFSNTSSAHLIILAQGRTPGNRFLSDLIDMNIYDFVTALNFRLATQQLAECINGRSIDSLSAYMLKKTLPKEKKSFFSVKGKKESRAPVVQDDKYKPDTTPTTPTKVKASKEQNTISIGVSGVYPRIGTTTQALRLTHYITQSGTTSCYVEANQNGHVPIIGSVFSEVKQTGSSYLYLGLTMFASSPLCPREDFSSIVYDFGTDTESMSFKACDLHIIIAGSSAWEMAALAQKMNSFEANYIYIFSFTSPAEHDDILSFMADKWKNTFFADFSPDMFCNLTLEEKTMYDKIIKLYKK